MADKKKASPDLVKAVQKFLKEQGFYKGDISGIKTWGTEAAIRAYQVQNKLKNTGEIDDVPTVAMSKSTPAPQAGGSAQPQAAAPATAPQANPNEGIIAPTPSMADKKKPSAEQIKGLQQSLKTRGFYYGDITGQEDEATQAAIRRYQIRGNLEKTGAVVDLLKHWASAPQTGGSAQPQASAPAAPQDDRVRGLESRATGRGRPVIPVPTPAPDKPAAPDAPPPAQPDAANPDDMPDPDPKTGKPWTAKGLEARDKERKKLADDQVKRDAQAAKDKEAEGNAGKPLWTKSEEAKAKYEARHGRPPPANWISGAPTNVLADQATIPQAMKDLGIYSTYSGDIDPKTGFTKPEVWEGLFKGSGKQDEGWTEIEGVGRVSADGRFQQKYGSKGRWGDVTAPLYLTLDKRFGGKDWHTEKAWSGASPDEKAAMIRADAGIPTPQVWVTPTDTTAAIGADTAALDGSSVDRMTGRAVPAGARMFSNEYGSGFVSKLPSASPAQGAGSQAAGQLPGVPPVAQDTPTIIDNAVKATRTKY